ncbi:GntR family transcriptional regulator [Halomicroarcula sp. F13]|uniref:GntR family transcriptional regulator n=1 Tax=Haloarcula rubra TaxID=2487747 RepID=A0AAW4PK61_9EURY|nr:GntR family transcriptional regulator [Halomicroarcula rubra]MBX0321430.1 GntR family transcriptional regulator [Halomicroarcula rubra]
MVTVPDTADVVAKRRDVLRALSTPTTKPELVERLGASRSTVDRAIDALTDESLVERRESRYVATYAGREALSAYDRFLGRLDALSEAQSVLAALPPDVDVDPAILEDAQVVESTPAAPERPVEANVERVRGAERFCGTGPAVVPRYIDVVASLVEGGGAEIELVLTDDVVEALSDVYPDGMDTLSGADGLSVFVTEQTMPYAVWTAEKPETTVSGIVVYDDTGIVGVVNNDTEAMNEWAREQYERFKDAARRLA